jgi:hypothetical protein
VWQIHNAWLNLAADFTSRSSIGFTGSNKQMLPEQFDVYSVLIFWKQQRQ